MFRSCFLTQLQFAWCKTVHLLVYMRQDCVPLGGQNGLCKHFLRMFYSLVPSTVVERVRFLFFMWRLKVLTLIRDSLGYAMHVIEIYSDGIFNQIFCHYVVRVYMADGRGGGGGGGFSAWRIQTLHGTFFSKCVFRNTEFKSGYAQFVVVVNSHGFRLRRLTVLLLIAMVLGSGG